MLTPPPESGPSPGEHHAKESATPERFREYIGKTATSCRWPTRWAPQARASAHTFASKTVTGGKSEGQRNLCTKGDGELAGRKDREETEQGNMGRCRHMAKPELPEQKWLAPPARQSFPVITRRRRHTIASSSRSASMLTEVVPSFTKPDLSWPRNESLLRRTARK